MSGLARKMNREQLKAQYNRFKRAWNDEKLYQKYLINTQGCQVESDGEGNQFVVDPNGDKLPMLNKKPTFNMWSKALLNKKAQQTPVQDEKQVEVEDLSWNEGG